MNLMIKGMDMPKHAIKNGTDDTLYRSCVIVHPDGTAELILDSTFADMFGFEHNLNRFPLVEIPTPHGRLIDADRLYETIEQMEGFGTIDNENDVVLSAVEVLTAIDEAPTIIKAEE